MTDNIKYIIQYFNLKRLVYLIITFVILSYFFAFIQNISISLFTLQLLGPSSVFSYLSFTLWNTVLYTGHLSGTIFIFTILTLSIYLIMFVSRFRDSHQVSDSALGVISGIITFFGLGCASCGGLVIASLFGVLGASIVLPFNGIEIQLLALVVSLISLFIFVRKDRVRVCEVDR